MTDIAPVRGHGLKRLGGTWGECLAEFLGTFVLIAFGDGVVAMAVAGLPGSGRTQSSTTIFLAAGDWLLIIWGWAMAVTFAIYVAGGVSGAHINPAVTLAFAVRRKFPWSKVGPYVVAQVVGAFVGAALVYLVYHDAIDALQRRAGHHEDRPAGQRDVLDLRDVPGTVLPRRVGRPVRRPDRRHRLPAHVRRRGDRRAQHRRPGQPRAADDRARRGGDRDVYGANAGYAINPARDFGPRLFAYLAGWGDVALPGTVPGAFSWYFWIPIVAPLIGGVIGVLIYDVFIGDVLHARAGREEPPGRTQEVEGAEARPAR